MPALDLLIVGAGPVGLALALALRDSGLRVALADARPAGAGREDPRVLALAHGSMLSLAALGIRTLPGASPIHTIHVSQQGGFGRTVLRAQDYGVDALGQVLRAGTLITALEEAVAAAGIPRLAPCRITRLTPGDQCLEATLSTGETITAALVARAEGAVETETQTDTASAVSTRDYDQHAVICMVRPARHPTQTAYERFTPQGPLALLPLGEEFAVVHTAPPTTADALLDLDDAAYLQRLQSHFGERVQFVDVGPRQRYPLGLRYRRQPVAARTVWLGNAAQTLHPVAGQGFNLALRDVCDLARLLLDLPPGADPGSADLLSRYSAARRLDRGGAILFTDLLVRLFSNPAAPLRHARGAGLFALDLFPPLRHFVAKRMMFGARAWP